MITIERHGERRVLITSDYPQRDREQLRQLPGSSYSVKQHIWTAPLTWATCQAMRGMFKDDLVIGPELAKWSVEEYETRVKPALEMRLAWDAPGDPDLYPFQRAGVKFLTYAKKALLCDEMGTGKTPQTIRTLMNIVREGKNPFPAVVVAPNNMTITWQKEFERFFPGVKVNVIKGGAKQRRELIEDPAHVYVINFEGVRMHTKLAQYGNVRLRRCFQCDPMMLDDKDHQPSKCEVHPRELNKIDFKTIIVDEAHRMKDPKSKQSMAIRALRSSSVEWTYCLTGTAIGDSPIDLWPSLNLIAPDEFPSRVAYIDRYCQQSFNIFGGMTITGLNPIHKDEFFRIVDPHMRRMPKEAVLPFLPAKSYSRRYVEMSAKQKRAYMQMDKNQIAVLEGSGGTGVVVAANPLTELTRLVQFSSAYAEINELGEVKLQAPSCKVDALLEWAEDNVDEPAVVFAQSRQLIEMAAAALGRKGYTYEMIVGGQSPDERELAKQNFQDGKVRFILCTISAGGIGITLTRSRVAIFLQRSWSMIENKQAEDRVHRIGSEIHDKIEIVDMISIGTVEESQQLALSGKLERLEEIMRDQDTVARMKAEVA